MSDATVGCDCQLGDAPTRLSTSGRRVRPVSRQGPTHLGRSLVETQRPEAVARRIDGFRRPEPGPFNEKCAGPWGGRSLDHFVCTQHQRSRNRRAQCLCRLRTGSKRALAASGSRYAKLVERTRLPLVGETDFACGRYSSMSIAVAAKLDSIVTRSASELPRVIKRSATAIAPH